MKKLYPWIDYYRKNIAHRSTKTIKNSYKIRVLVVLQPLQHDNPEIIPDFIVSYLLCNKTKDAHFTFRMHPNDNSYPYCIKRLRGVSSSLYSIDLGESVLYDAFLSSTHHITAYSSCAYEAELFNLPTLLYGNESRKIYAEDIIDNAIKENKGVIFMTPHHGSWELSGLVAASKINTYTMVKPLRNKILNRFVLSGRKAKGSILVETNNAGVKSLLKALKNKNGIGILPDHTPKINQGVMSNFFNVPVNTNTLIHKLSKKNKVPIIYIFSERLSWGRGFNIHVGLVDQLFYDLDEVKAAGLLNKTLEGLVMRNITQYQWSYERFRNRSGVKESIYN